MQRLLSFLDSFRTNENVVTKQSTYEIIGYNFYNPLHEHLPARKPINQLDFDFLFILIAAYDNNRNYFHQQAKQEKPPEKQEDYANPYNIDLDLAREMHKAAMDRIGVNKMPVPPVRTYQQLNAAFDALLTEFARQGINLCQARKVSNHEDIAVIIEVIEKSPYMKINAEMNKFLSELKQLNPGPTP